MLRPGIVTLIGLLALLACATSALARSHRAHGSRVFAKNHRARRASAVNRLVARIYVYPSTTVGVGESVDFSSSDSSGGPSKEAWSFGDGPDAHGQAASHSWTAPGAYTVRLRISDKHGRHSQASTVITVRRLEPPQPRLAVEGTGPQPGALTLDASQSSDPNGGDIVNYEWDFLGNGDFVQGGDHATYTYAASGTYTVRLRVTDSHGLEAETEQAVTVAGPPPPPPSGPGIVCNSTHAWVGLWLSCYADDSQAPFPVVNHVWDVAGENFHAESVSSVMFPCWNPGWQRVVLRMIGPSGQEVDAGLVILVG